MSSFRIEVDLTDFFNDHRRRAYIFIRPELRTVSCLENHISETFGLDRIAIVVNEEIYLPSAEKIEVVQKKDVLKVVATEESSKRKKSKKNLVNDDLLGDKIKNKAQLNGEHRVQNGQETLENRMEISNDDVENSMNNSLVVPKSKRKRKRCKKTKTIQDERCERKENTCNKQVNITNQETEAKANHIRFDESLNAQVETDEKVEEVRWENTLDQLNTTEPRIIFATIVEPPVTVENIKEQDEELLPVATVNGDRKSIMNGEGKVDVNDMANNL